METIGNRKRQITIEGIIIAPESVVWGPRIAILEETLEFRDTGSDFGPFWVGIASTRSQADYDSPVVAEGMAVAKKEHWLKGFYERFLRVYREHAAEIAGDEIMRTASETAEDRRIAEAIARGVPFEKL